MEDEDFSELVALVKERLNEIGLGDLADDSNYYFEEGGLSESPRTAQAHLAQLLKTFEAHLALLDRSTVSQNLHAIGEMCAEGPQGAIYVAPNPARTEVGIEISLIEQLPELAALRESVHALIVKVLEAGHG